MTNRNNTINQLGSGYDGTYGFIFTEVKSAITDEIHCQWTNGKLDIEPRKANMSAQEQAERWVAALLGCTYDDLNMQPISEDV